MSSPPTYGLPSPAQFRQQQATSNASNKAAPKALPVSPLVAEADRQIATMGIPNAAIGERRVPQSSQSSQATSSQVTSPPAARTLGLSLIHI